MKRETRIQFASRRWLAQNFIEKIPKKLNERGFNFSFQWLDKYDKFIQDPEAKALFCYGHCVSGFFHSASRHKECTIPIIHHVWDLPTFKFYDDYDYNFFWNNYRYTLKRAYKVLTWSKFVQRQLKDILGIDSEIGFNYFDNEKIDSIPPQPKKNQIIIATRFAPQKNWEVVIKALGALEQCKSQLGGMGNTIPTLVMMGSGYKEALERVEVLCKEAKIKYEFPYGWEIPGGYAESGHDLIIKAIKESKLMVNMSYFEGLGLTPKESIWAGTPVICGDIPPIREYHGDTIPLVATADYRTLAWEIKKILRHDFDLTQAKKQIEYLTIENCVDRMEQWFLNLDI